MVNAGAPERRVRLLTFSVSNIQNESLRPCLEFVYVRMHGWEEPVVS